MRPRRTVIASSSLAILLVLLGPPALQSNASTACLLPPVVAPVAEPFRMPPCRYCAGHRGIEFATDPGTQVVAAASGVVTFAGSVAGARYVVIRDRAGIRATYGGLATVSSGMTAGADVQVGALVGRATDRFYFGLRADDPEETSIDPTPLLGRWRYRARLLPTDGHGSRLPPAPRLVCRNGSPPR